MNRFVVLVLRLVLALLLVTTVVACSPGDGDAQKYHCPMHPTYVSDRPGDCPICGMRLVPIERDGRKGATAGAEHAPPAGPGTRYAVKGPGAYACPMHPEFRSDDPAARCPECGMKLRPVEEIEGSGAASRTDRVPVEIPAAGIDLAGIKTAPAERGRIGRGIRTSGEVTVDETRVRHVHTKIDGWVERLHVNSTGQEVRRGQPILSIYAPELLAAQEEFVQARASASRFMQSGVPEVREGAEDIVRAARRRLELLDVPPAVIEQLERTGTATRAITLVAPVSGVVTSKDIFEGQQVEPGMELFTVTDLSRVWVEADIYEQEAAAIRPGLPARISSPFLPGTTREGRVSFVYPFLDRESRTLRVRFEFANPGLELKPAMFVDVAFDLGAREGILVPDSAVLDTGTRQLVFVDQGGGRFAPRDVRLGIRSDGKAEILSGVAEGERVAVRANFLLDAESRLRAVLAQP